MEVIKEFEPRDIFLRIFNSARDNVRLELELKDETEEALKKQAGMLNYNDNIEKLKGKFAKKKRGRKKATGGDSPGLRLLSATVVTEFKRLHPYLYRMFTAVVDDADDQIKEKVKEYWETEMNADERQLFEDIAEAAQQMKPCKGNCKVHTAGLSLYVKYLANTRKLGTKEARERWNDESEDERQEWETMAEEAKKLGFGKKTSGLAGKKRKLSSSAAVGGKKVKKAKSPAADKKKGKAPAASKKRRKAAAPVANKKKKSKVPGANKKKQKKQAQGASKKRKGKAPLASKKRKTKAPLASKKKKSKTPLASKKRKSKAPVAKCR